MKNQHGFSLMEVLIALFIIGLFAGGAAVGVKKIGEGAKIKKAQQDLRTFAAAVDQFEMDNRRYPTSLAELVKDPGDLPNYQPGGYLNKEEVPRDPWGSDYQFSADGAPEGRAYEITCWGPDKSEGGKDYKLSELE